MMKKKLKAKRIILTDNLLTNNLDLRKDLEDYTFDDPASFLSALEKQPSLYANWALLRTRVENKLNLLKNKRERRRKEVRTGIQESLEKKSKSKGLRAHPTKDDIETEINRVYSSELLEIDTKILKLEAQFNLLGVAVSALVQKKDSLRAGSMVITEQIKNSDLFFPEKVKEEKKENEREVT